MTKTKREVAARALRDLGVLSAFDEADAEQYAYCEQALETLFAELSEDMTIAWDLTAVPDTHFLALADVLGVEIAAHYEVQPRKTRARAIMRFRALQIPDDREDARDLDGDGAVDEDEAAAATRAAFY